LAERFGDIEVLLDILRAADGRHTLADCAEAAASAPDVASVPWPAFWDACVAASVVPPVGADGLVRLPDPAVAEVLAGELLLGDRYFGMRHDEPADIARSASATRLAAVVGHTLALDDMDDARELCTDLDVL